MVEAPNRCRLILALPTDPLIVSSEKSLAQALEGGDVASVIFPRGELAWQEYCETFQAAIKITQDHNAAALAASDVPSEDEFAFDGLLITSGQSELKNAIARFSPQKIVGYGVKQKRHTALEAGESNPDFVMFGRLGNDTHEQTRPANLEIGEWWADLVDIPCALLGGNTVESIAQIAASGADFAVLSRAVFCHDKGPAFAVAQANSLLDEHGPIFDNEQ